MHVLIEIGMLSRIVVALVEMMSSEFLCLF
jgi:hypothetical protein